MQQTVLKLTQSVAPFAIKNSKTVCCKNFHLILPHPENVLYRTKNSTSEYLAFLDPFPTIISKGISNCLP